MSLLQWLAISCRKCNQNIAIPLFQLSAHCELRFSTFRTRMLLSVLTFSPQTSWTEYSWKEATVRTTQAGRGCYCYCNQNKQSAFFPFECGSRITYLPRDKTKSCRHRLSCSWPGDCCSDQFREYSKNVMFDTVKILNLVPTNYLLRFPWRDSVFLVKNHDLSAAKLTFGFHKMLRISWPAKRLLASHL
jgi:hypothetical protein